MRINTNVMALNTGRQLGITNANTTKSLEKLSSGLRINRAGDDAAGLAISEKMRGQIRGLQKASANAQDGISLIQTAEGALNESHSILQRMRELSVQSSNDTLVSSDRTQLQGEMDQLASELTRIATTTEFNTKVLMSGGFGASKVVANVNTNISDINKTNPTTSSVGVSIAQIVGGTSEVITSGNVSGTGHVTAETKVTASTTPSATSISSSTSLKFHVGANMNQTISLSISNMSATSLGVTAAVANNDGVSAGAGANGAAVKGISISSRAGAEAAMFVINNAIKIVSTERAKLGSVQNRLEYTSNNLDTATENLQASESRIRDVDMAKEMMNYTKLNILSQAGTAMLSQANQKPQAVLQLLG